MKKNRYYFSTRDLLMMAALAAMGGVTSTYIKALSDLVRSFVGFPGASQWAAGLHVLWLTLAVGLTGKQGAGTVTGVLKGVVELLSGNAHGLLVLLVDVAAGLLVDLGFLPFRDKDAAPGYVLAGGLASASNVFVFQLFASVPAAVLPTGAMLILAGVAFCSGVVFAGLMARGLLMALRRAGVVKDSPPKPMGRRAYPIFLAAVALLGLSMGLYMRQALRAPATIHVGGAVAAPYDYPTTHGDLAERSAEGTLRDVTADYTGVPLRDLVARAQPQPGAAMVLVEASDGYAFFISMDEIRENASLLLSRQGKGDEVAYSVVGAENSKAWVRGVSSITVVGAASLEVTGSLDAPAPYDPDDWQFEMDSVPLDVDGSGAQKVQGAPLGAVLASMQPQAGAASVVLHADGDAVTLPLDDVLADDDVRLFTIIGEGGVTFAAARMSGDVLAYPVTRIEVSP